MGAVQWSLPLLPSSLGWLSVETGSGRLGGVPPDLVAPAAALRRPGRRRDGHRSTGAVRSAWPVAKAAALPVEWPTRYEPALCQRKSGLPRRTPSAPASRTSASHPRRRSHPLRRDLQRGLPARLRQPLSGNLHVRQLGCSLRRGHPGVLPRQRRPPGGLRLRLVAERGALRLLPERPAPRPIRGAHVEAGTPSCAGGRCSYACQFPWSNCTGRGCRSPPPDDDPDGCETDFSEPADVRRHRSNAPGSPMASRPAPSWGRLDLWPRLQHRLRPVALRDSASCRPLSDPKTVGGVAAPARRSAAESSGRCAPATGACCVQTCDPDRQPPCGPAKCTPP